VESKRALASLVFFITGFFPQRITIATAKLTSLAYYSFNIRSKSIVKENLKKMHVKFSIKQYLNFSQFLTENLCLFNNNLSLSRFRFHGMNVLEEAVKSGRPVFLVSVHYGNWELTGQALQRLGFKLTVIYEKNGDWIYDYIDKIRTKYGLRLLDKNASFADLKREIDEGRIIVFLIDRRSSNSSLKKVNFLGIETELPCGWFRIMKRTNAYPVAALTRFEKRRHHLYLMDASEWSFEKFYEKFDRMIKKDIFQYDFYSQMWKDLSR